MPDWPKCSPPNKGVGRDFFQPPHSAPSHSQIHDPVQVPKKKGGGYQRIHAKHGISLFHQDPNTLCDGGSASAGEIPLPLSFFYLFNKAGRNSVEVGQVVGCNPRLHRPGKCASSFWRAANFLLTYPRPSHAPHQTFPFLSILTFFLSTPKTPHLSIGWLHLT